jgi:predicted RecB family nuclease
MHLNREYVYAGGEHDLEQLFVLQDLTERVRALQSDVERELESMRASLHGDTAPQVAVGPHCEEPYTCSFYEHCHEGLPEDPFAALPRVTRKLRARLESAGIATLDELELDFRGLSLLQRRALEALRTGKRVVDSAACEALTAVQFPVHFVDFEAFSPAIPLYAGTRPYEVIPFQWSDHELRENGLIHREFLHDGEGDPRREFAERLLEVTNGAKSVIVYSNFENQCLADLQTALPDLSEPLGDLRSRLFDLLPVIRRHVYDGAFGGSFSIKAVLPALVPHMGYDDLQIAEGSLASVAFSEIVSGGISLERRSELRNNLLAYCKRDTEAMCELFRVLR